MAFEYRTYGYVDASGAESDVASIAAGQSYTTPGQVIELQGHREIYVQFKAQGAAGGSAGTVSFYLSFSVDGIHFGTSGTEFGVDLNANNPVVSEPLIVAVRGFKAMRVLKIVNGDSAQAVTNLNAIIAAVMH